MAIFCFTDIEGSTEKWEKHAGVMGQVIARHNHILEKNVAAHGGQVIKHTGDGIFAIFDGPAALAGGPLACALEIQRQIQSEAWPGIGELRVRMAFHSGEAEKLAGDYYGPVANRTARLMSLGWGGQILVSDEFRSLGAVPEGAALEDLGVHQVKDLPEPQQVYGLTHPSLKLNQFPPLKSLSHRPHNLPVSLTPFVGREKELALVMAALAPAHNRLVTVKGSGGMGKTRLCIQAGHELLKDFKHGVCHVPLETLPDAGAMAARIAESLRFTFYSHEDPKVQLFNYLREKEMLLILDHMDHLAAEAGLLQEILLAAPRVKLLVSSRCKLNQVTETLVEIEGLEVPGPSETAMENFSAPRLFLQRARKIKADFSVKPGEEPVLAQICRQLEGMPLGLELAAAWVRTLTLKEIGRRLESSLAVLFSSDKDLPERQRSMRGLFDHSWKMLKPEAQRTFRNLSVFAGPFSGEAARAVAPCSAEELVNLVDRSLLKTAGEGRFLMPGHLRPFAVAKLEQSPAEKQVTLGSFTRFYFGFLSAREGALKGTGLVAGLAAVNREIENVRKAWKWAVDQSWVKEISQGARCLGLYTDLLCLSAEWAPLMEEALALWAGNENRAFEGAAAEETLKAYAVLSGLVAQSRFHAGLATGSETARALEKSVSLFKKVRNRDEASYALVQLSGYRIPEDLRKRCLTEAQEWYRQTGDANGEAWARAGLGNQCWNQGQKPEGKRMVAESLAVFARVGNLKDEADCLKMLGAMALEEGATAEGIRTFEQAKDLFMALGNRQEAGWAMNHLGNFFIRRRAWNDGLPFVEEGLTLFESVGYDKGIQASFNHLSEAYWSLGDLDKALALVDQSLAHAGTLAHGDWYKGRAFMEKAEILLHQGTLDEALALSQEGLRIMQGARSLSGSAEAVEIEAQILLAMGQAEKARDLFRKAAADFSQGGAEWRGRNAWALVKAADAELAMGRGPEAIRNYGRILSQAGGLVVEDTAVAALKGLAAALARDKKHLDSIRLTQLCARLSLDEKVSVSRARYFEKTRQEVSALLAEVSGKLLPTAVSDARTWARTAPVSATIKETVSKYCT